jgi:uncharacterized protein YraI
MRRDARNMMSKFGLIFLRILVAMVLPAMAAAQTATTAKNVHLRAGPAREYPVVAVLPAGMEVSVLGCLSGYSWCDVIAGAERGWVWAGNLNYLYQGAYVPLIPYAQQIGVVVAPFVFFDYWSDHYRNRPWYPDRDRWARPPRHPPPGLRPPPGPRPPSGSQPHPTPTHPAPGHTDSRLPPPPPPGISRQAAPPARGAQSEQRR